MQRQELLQWYIDAGVDETVGEGTCDHRAAPLAPMAAPPPAATAAKPASFAAMPPAAAIAEARRLADAAATREELEQAVRNFNGCALKRTATNTVFSRGSPQARVMVIGEAPGAQEDMQGIPFCGPSGMLLDKMLAAIGLTEANCYISNTLFWRPPGNRPPNNDELAICEPFVEKHIALIHPALIILAGGTAAKGVLKTEQSVSRLRGTRQSYTNRYLREPITVMLTFHPSYLLRSPAQKRLAWHDLLEMQAFLQSKALY